MYEKFYNLKHKPFSLLPDPDFLFLSDKHAVALSLLEYSLNGQAGFCVITGDIGSGKTTLVRAFLGRIGREFSVGLISNTHHALKNVAEWALNAFGQKATTASPAETYQELVAYVISEYGHGRQSVLIVDEAQNLSIEMLEELRLLSNINTGKDLLLLIVLVGQPELLEKLRRPELSQFAQRIAVSHHLSPLSYAETRRYVEHRVKVAGADRSLFTEMAVGAIQYFSGGVPRLINSICDMAMVYGFADGVQTITEDLIFRVIADRQKSGLAPFVRSESADDPDVRAAISSLTQSLADDQKVDGAESATRLDGKQEAAPDAAAVLEQHSMPGDIEDEGASLSQSVASPDRGEERIFPEEEEILLSVQLPVGDELNGRVHDHEVVGPEPVGAESPVAPEGGQIPGETKSWPSIRRHPSWRAEDGGTAVRDGTGEAAPRSWWRRRFSRGS